MGEQVAAGTNGGIAQMGEHLPCKQGVKGSNPFISTKIFRRAAGQDERVYPPESSLSRGYTLSSWRIFEEYP